MQKLKLLFQIFISFFKISAFTFGGGFAMLPLLQSEIVKRREWMREDEVIDIFAMSQLMPGVIFINVSCLIGIRIWGILGATIATIAVLLPAVLATLILMSLISLVNKDVLNKVFKGIVCGVSAILLTVAGQLFKKHINNFITVVIFITSFIVLEFFNIKVYYVLLAGIVLGICYYYIMKRRGKINA